MRNRPVLTEETDLSKLPPPERKPHRRLVLHTERERSARSSIEARQRINDFAKRAHPGVGSEFDPSHEFSIGALEKSLRDLESSLFEREQNVQEREVRLLERERNLWESEALLYAREELLEAREARLDLKTSASTIGSAEELEALERLRDEVARQQESLKEQKIELKDREQFIENSENTLLDKSMQQQEEECRLEQMTEDLKARELRINALEGKPPPPEEPKEVL